MKDLFKKQDDPRLEILRAMAQTAVAMLVGFVLILVVLYIIFGI